MAPPKGQVKKHKKPLTPLQRKQLKRKNELIQKAKVKSQYYKELNKDPDDDTPDYVKDIFRSERTIDEKGNVVEREVEVEEQEEEQEFDLDEESSSEEEDEEEDEDEEERPGKRAKPNPFKSQLEAFQESQTQKVESKKEKQERIEREKKDRKKYYRERNEQRGKMLARTKKGQPKMATQMDVLLSKIQKNMKNE